MLSPPRFYHPAQLLNQSAGPLQEYRATLDRVIELNPQITDPNLIFPGAAGSGGMQGVLEQARGWRKRLTES